MFDAKQQSYFESESESEHATSPANGESHVRSQSMSILFDLGCIMCQFKRPANDKYLYFEYEGTLFHIIYARGSYVDVFCNRSLASINKDRDSTTAITLWILLSVLVKQSLHSSTHESTVLK